VEKILKILAADLSFLYRRYHFKIIDSEFSESFGGSGYIVLIKDSMKVRLLQSRDGVFLEFGENIKNPKWYSFDVIQRLLSDEDDRKYNNVVNKLNLSSLDSGMTELLSFFSEEKIESTKKLLVDYTRERSKKLFKKKL